MILQPLKRIFAKHDECNITVVSSVDAEMAELIGNTLVERGVSLGALWGESFTVFIGDWMAEPSRSYTNGTNWDCVYEIVRCHEVTETITVTKWKPI